MSQSSKFTGDAAPTAPAVISTPLAEANASAPNIHDAAVAAAMQIQRKNEEERAKRLRADGNRQYTELQASEKFKHFQDDPWVELDSEEVGPPALVAGQACKFLVLGAGFGGLLFAVNLIKSGVKANDIRIVDSAGGFGGTWYWNRYPGLMCDVAAMVYMPLLEETGYIPKNKYAYGFELREYANSIAKKWGLRDKAMFGTSMKTLTWDDSEKEWAVTMVQERGGQESKLSVTAQFVFSAPGLLSTPKIPDVRGIENFQGHSFHTSRWDYKYTGGSPTDSSLINLKDKRVGIIGTGATAVQAVPHLAKWAKELYVFQRTPSSVAPRGQGPTDTKWWACATEGKGWHQEWKENFNAHLSNVSPRPAVDYVGDEWSDAPGFSALLGGPTPVSMETVAAFVGGLHALDMPRQVRIRDRVDKTVKDRATAEKLKPWYPTWCKRPCFHDDYLPAFNEPGVTLVDTNVGSPGYRANMTVTGRNGKSMDEKWANGVSTLHGVFSREFPNLFWAGPLQAAATANQMYVLDVLSAHAAYIIAQAAKKAGPGQKFTVEPTAEAEEEWGMQIMARALAFAGMAGCTPGYLNLEGMTDRITGQEQQMKAARGATWGAGIADFVRHIESWRAEGSMRGVDVVAA